MNTSILNLLDQATINYKGKVLYRDPENESKGGAASITFDEFSLLTKKIGTGIIKAVSKDGEKNIVEKKAHTPEPIAVMTGRHMYTPACFLGVVRAGFFYAAMEAELPESRLLQIMKVASPAYIITDRENLEKTRDIVEKSLADNSETPSIEILIMEELMETEPDESLLAEAQDNLTEYSPLYMIFTSGSTGVPKGVLTSHHSVFCYLDGLNDVIKLNDTDVLGNQSPLDYIAAVRDMYLPLFTGCETVIIPRNTTAMPEELFGILNEYKVTTLCWSASGLEVLAKLGAFKSEKIKPPQHVKRIVFSGSVMSGKYLKMWQEALPETVFINQYGPTETTASCTYYVVPDVVNEDTVLPIGKPYKHYRVFLLADFEDVEGGIEKDEIQGDSAYDGIGEICVAGPGLAIGYYRNDEQTNKVFVRNPLLKDYYERIYLTGDLGKYDENGDLLFLGRKDRQVKHLGHRIELAEIEMAAMNIDGITGAISMYQKEASLLYLFYTGTATPKDIALYFRGNMPAYMVPRKTIQLNEMPTLPNGKIDMPALKGMMK